MTATTSKPETIPEEYLLNPDKDRRQRLMSQYYRHHHQNRNVNEVKDNEDKILFFKEKISEWKRRHNLTHVVGVDLGCRSATFTTQLAGYASWVGVDIDDNAIAEARMKGILCNQMDISVNIDLTSAAFNIVMLTEVLEHLPYPAITIKEIHRILKKGRTPGIFIGSVPIDYNFHQRLRVFRGQRIEKDPTHLHSFSFHELDTLLKHYFKTVEYLPLRGTASRHPWLPYQYFVRDLAWVASDPLSRPEPWTIRIIH